MSNLHRIAGSLALLATLLAGTTTGARAGDLPPSISLTSPANGTVLAAPATVNLAATAVDTDGVIRKVEFYRGTTFLGSRTAAPYTLSVSSVPAGTYGYTAKAYDNLGVVATSAAVNVTVTATNKVPTVSLTAPANGTSLAAPARVNLAATAGDTDGTISKVEFYRGTTLLTTLGSTPPYAYADANVAAGAYSYTAKAYDNSGGITTSAAVSVTVTATNKAPTVSITSPANGTTLSAPATVNLAASTADSDGTIAKVEFYRGSTLINTDYTAPFSYSDSVAAGAYSYTAKAYDNLGVVTTSTAVSVTVTATNKAPTVSLTSPANGASFTTPANINLAASAADTDGTISKVEFYRGSTLINTDTTAPYGYSETGLGAGTYTYTAKAYDNLGAVTTSAAVTVTMSGATPRPLSVSLSGAGAGAVVSSPSGIDCGSTCLATFAANSIVTLTATPTGTATFAGWIGACTGTVPTCIVTMSQARAVDAAFAVPTATNYLYDANGNLTQVTDPLGRIRKTNYDALDRPYQVLEPSPTTVGSTQGQITTAYDGQDQPATITDPRSVATTYTVDGLGNLLTLASPDTGSTTATYDEAGNLRTRTDARGITVTYTYDALNRLTQIAYGDQTVTVTWDSCANGIGRLCKLTDASGATAYAYSSQGRLSTKSQTIGGVVLTTQYGYDADGRPSSLTTPSGKLIAYDWTDGVRTGLRVNGAAQLTNISYRPFGPVAGWTWGNGQTVVRHFDAAGRLKSVSFGNNVAGSVDTRGLAYDAAGRIIALVDGLDTSLNQTHGYDGLDRLTASRLTTASLTTYGYGYDLSGNRTSRTLNGVTTTYTTATTSNRLLSLSGGQAKAYGYDNAGNIWADGTLSFGFDHAGRRTWSKSGSVTTYYTYNALGQRVKKVGPNGTTLYAYDEAGQLIGEYDGTGAAVQETVWLSEIPVLTLRGANVYYVHADHLNTPRRVTRPADNKPVWMWEAEPFGNALPDQNPAGLGAFVYNLRMPGQVYDLETGQFYNYHRYFDPGTGRYTTSDPIGLDGGINTYAYALNNPLTYTDPFGLEVSICCRPAQIANGIVDHCWVQTDTISAGMGANPDIPPGQQYEGYGMEVQITDHSKDTPTHCTPQKDVNEQCVNEKLVIGKPIGRFLPPVNQCQRFAKYVVTSCRNTPRILLQGR